MNYNRELNLTYRNKNWLYQKYWEEKLSVAKVAQKAKVNVFTIFYWLEKFGIKRRDRKEVCRDYLGSLKGDKNYNWKGGRIKYHGYIYILQREHPNALKNGYVAEHRLIMEKKLGRYLTYNEQVHHKNGIKTDNRRKNLELVLRKSHQGKVKCPYCQKEFLIK